MKGKTIKPVSTYVADLVKIGMSDVARFGGKNASLGELMQHLATSGVRVPRGFAVSAEAYRETIAAAQLDRAILNAATAWREGEPVAKRAALLREAIVAAPLPEPVADSVRNAYRQLCIVTGRKQIAVAVRSSATAEDLPGASFAGQQESFLNVHGEEALLTACRACFASLFTDRAIAYREEMGFSHHAVALSVGIQEMVRSDIGASGVMFTLDPDSGFPNVVTISAAWGLGETVVQGAVEPDSYTVFKPLLDYPRLAPVISHRLGAKAERSVYARAGGTKRLPTPRALRDAWVLSDAEALQLARWGVAIERHYDRPMDIEWARDGTTGELFIVQARPETGQSHRKLPTRSRWRLKEDATPILSGVAIGQAIATGEAWLVRDVADLAAFPDGAMIVAPMTDPDWVPAMRRAAGIVTDHGGATSHAAIVARELGLPAVVGTGLATKRLAQGQPVTLSCAEGEIGHVYSGLLKFEATYEDDAVLPRTKTALMVNLADPANAMRWWRLPADGVGLARIEFIVSGAICAHPLALLHPERLSPRERRQIKHMVAPFSGPEEFFVNTLAEGIARLAAVFHPNPAIVRFGDFKTNEYAHLLGGRQFEPQEENPMLGLRGASRYYHPTYREAFLLECRAIRRAREDLGFTNIIPMIPFCRTPHEADLVLAEMAQEGLGRGRHGLKVYVMAEIPANVVLAEEFAKRFDGFSIGSNDLTQLLLGIDRDSRELAAQFDERDLAVTRTIADLISRAHSAHRHVGICGQAPSNHPDFAAFLVEQGIDSISLNPDSFVATMRSVAAAEHNLAMVSLNSVGGSYQDARK
jgi:pyruvate,water dikinase